AITLSKSSSSAPTAAGETVSYAFVITNMGNVTLTDIAFSDALLNVATVPVDAVWTLGSPTTGLAPGGTVSFGLDHVVSQAEVDAGAVSNSASASGQPPTGARV